jgi:hypothetical protein
VRAAYLDGLAAVEVLESEREARLDGDHAVEAERSRGDPRRRVALVLGQVSAGGVAFGGGAAAGELAVVVEPGGEDLDVVVVHRAVGADELLERDGDLICELMRRPVLDPAPDRIIEPRLLNCLLFGSEAAVLVVAAAAAGAGCVPWKAHARAR